MTSGVTLKDEENTDNLDADVRSVVAVVKGKAFQGGLLAEQKSQVNWVIISTSKIDGWCDWMNS